jgi:hypothetical protein
VKNLSLKSAQELLQQIVVAPLPRADSKKNGSGIFGPAGERELTAEERKALSWAVAELADQSWRRSSRWSKARFQSLKFAEKCQIMTRFQGRGDNLIEYRIISAINSGQYFECRHHKRPFPSSTSYNISRCVTRYI